MFATSRIAPALLLVALIAGFVACNGIPGRSGDEPEASLERERVPDGTFGALPTAESVVAVRTPNGFVLPVEDDLGDGRYEVMTPCAATAIVDGAVPVDGAHVVLDPGHGGTETGAIGPTGLDEATVNLDVSLRTARLLEQQGATVVLTRDTDVRVTIQTRARLAAVLEPLAFVSVHHNGGATRRSEVPGTEVYHHLSDDRSRRLAGLLWEELQERLSPYGRDWVVGDATGARARESTDGGDDFYGILRRTQGVPGVLSEAAYLSNRPEEALLATSEVREAEATAIATAVLRFVSTDEPGSGFLSPFRADVSPGGGGGTGGCVDPEL